jgi:hypothetical protein
MRGDWVSKLLHLMALLSIGGAILAGLPFLSSAKMTPGESYLRIAAAVGGLLTAALWEGLAQAASAAFWAEDRARQLEERVERLEKGATPGAG